MSETALVKIEDRTVAESEPFSAFGSLTQFKDAQRMAMALCSSSIVPETYRGENRIGDCVIALEIANRIGASVLAVMQNLYVVYGRPAWSSQFLISCVNASRRFSPLRYQMTGDRKGDDWGCVAWAEDRSGERLESPEVTIGMAKAEGWYQKNGSKWKTMPELMLRYRAATLFARLYAPELTMGIQTDEEIIDIAPVVTDPVRRAKQVSSAPSFAAPEPEPAAPAEADKEAAAGLAPAQEAPTPTHPPAAAPVAPLIVLPTDPTPGSPQSQLMDFLTDAGVHFSSFVAWLSETKRHADPTSLCGWAELPSDLCAEFAKDTKTLTRCVTRCKTIQEK